MFKFLKDVYKQISKDKSSVEITEHTEEFKKMYDNGVRFFYINANLILYNFGIFLANEAAEESQEDSEVI